MEPRHFSTCTKKYLKHNIAKPLPSKLTVLKKEYPVLIININFIISIFKGTQARHDVQRMKKMYPDLSGSNFNSLQLLQDGAWAKVIIRSKYGNMMNRTVLEEVREMDTAIQNITAVSDEGTFIKVM